MDIIFCGIDAKLCAAWEAALRHPSLSIPARVVCCDITSIKVDAVVSPANSFGFMDGGVDLAYSHTFGWHVQARLQAAIQQMPFGELLVGQALAVETDDLDIPLLIAAPAMRIPRNILDSEAIFLAARSAVNEAKRIGVASLAFPGMGTGTGGVPPEIAAPLMVRGIKEGLHERSFPRSLKCLYAL